MLEILRKFFRFCDERERSEFYRSIVLGVLAALFSALKIPAIGVMLQAILVEGVTAKTILLSLAVMLISVIGSSILKYRATALQTDGGYSTTANKRVQIAEHLRYLPMGYFNENSLGAITSVTTNTMDNLSGVSTRVVMLVTEGIFSTAVMTLAVFLFDWRVGLFIIAGLAVYYAVNHALQIRSEQTTRRKFAGDTAVVEQVLEFIKGIAKVKSYSLIGRYNRRLEDTIEENVNANTDMELKLLPLMLTQNVVAKLIDMGVVVLSLILYTGGRMELLNCVMLCICSFLLTEGLEQAGTQSSLLRVVDTCVDQAADILDLPAMDISGAELTPEHHDLHADHITFSYGEKQIIHGVTLDIPERTTTAIVGPSGGGKTTLCHLLSRFWDVDAGQVTLGGHDVREYDMDSLMRNFSFVFQNVYLFHDTIANNICFGQPDAPIEQVIAAAKKARCHDFIMKLPQGYDTVIGEAGGSLSGGERQRLSIARAMMKDAPIVILDEATAKVKQVGTKTEQGRYSSKYALTELLICGECGTPYRRCTWAANGKKKVVWRCINRLDYGKKYCHDSPSIEESVLQEAIMKAVMQTARQNAEVLKTLKLHIGMGLSAETTEDNSLDLQIRIAEIEAEFQKMLKAIAADNVEAFDEEKAKALMDEKAKLQIQLDRIADTKQKRKNAKSRLDEIFTIIEALANHPISYDDQIVRQILESVIVESKEKIKVVFVGGLEVTQTM